MDEFDQMASWRALLDAQHGVVTREQALAHGFSDARVLAQVSAGRWARCGWGILATTTGPLTSEAAIRAALLRAGPTAALSHATAGARWTMLPASPTPPWHVTVPYGLSGRGSPEIVLHRSRAFVHIVTEIDGVPLTTPAHTALDLAVAEPDARTAMGQLLRTATAARVAPQSLRIAIELRRPPRYRRALLDGVRLLSEGVTSVLEAGYALEVERDHGLPPSERQVPVDVDGGTLFEDCTYRCPEGELIVRLDGHAYHTARRVRLRDRRRGNAAQLLGRSVLVFGWEEVRGDPCGCADEVAAAMRALGWAGEVTRCPRCASAA